MKINGSELQSKLTVYRTVHVQENKMAAKSGSATSITPQQDRVDLSGRGMMIADAQRAMAFVPDVRHGLVSRIQTDLQRGAYAIDHQKAAEGLLRESLVNQAAMG